MGPSFWPDVTRLVLPLAPEALVFVAGLIVTIALRRRLHGRDLHRLDAVAGVGGVAWGLWVLSRYGIRPTWTEQGELVRPAGLELTQALQKPMSIVLLVIYLVGLMFVTAAVFVSRSSHLPAQGRSR